MRHLPPFGRDSPGAKLAVDHNQQARIHGAAVQDRLVAHHAAFGGQVRQLLPLCLRQGRKQLGMRKRIAAGGQGERTTHGAP